MALYEVSYEVLYGGTSSHCKTVLSLDSPSESQALETLRRQGTVSRNDRVVIKRIDRK